jgi:hypothetical protein
VQRTSVWESVKKRGSWKDTTIQRRLEHRNWKMSTVRSCYHGMAAEDTSVCCVICKEWKSAMALQLLVVPSRVYKWSINPIQKPVGSHIHTPDNIMKNHWL